MEVTVVQLLEALIYYHTLWVKVEVTVIQLSYYHTLWARWRSRYFS